MKHSIEITKEAAWLLIGNDEKTWVDFNQYEMIEKSTYQSHGVRIESVHNYISCVTQYFIQDINA